MWNKGLLEHKKARGENKNEIRKAHLDNCIGCFRSLPVKQPFQLRKRLWHGRDDGWIWGYDGLRLGIRLAHLNCINLTHHLALEAD